MSFPDLRKANFYDVILGAGHPGVFVATYNDQQSEPRAVWAKRTDGGKRLDPDRNVAAERAEARFLFRVGRDEAHAKSGIVQPKIGDTLIDPAEPDQPYAFTGVIMDVTPHSHTIECTRQTPFTAGATAR